MRATHFTRAALVGTLVVVAFNFLIAHFAANLPPQQLLRRIREGAAPVRTIFLGDSQMAADADPAAFAPACPQAAPAFNAAIGATYASEHELVLQYLLRYARSTETVFYGFFDTLPTDPIPARWHNLVGNRVIDYLFPDHASTLLAPEGGPGRWFMRAIAYVPMVRERTALWAKVERLRRRVSRIGLPPEETNPFGRAADFRSYEPRDPVTFSHTLQTALARDQPLNPSFRQIIETCAAKQLKFYLIEMPVPSQHRQRFYSITSWLAYLQHVQSLVEAGHGQLIDASDWVADRDFEDVLHLNATGAAIFSARLARKTCGHATAFELSRELNARDFQKDHSSFALGQTK